MELGCWPALIAWVLAVPPPLAPVPGLGTTGLGCLSGIWSVACLTQGQTNPFNPELHTHSLETLCLLL